MNIVKNMKSIKCYGIIRRKLSTSGLNFANKSCKVLVVGAGTAGTAVAAKISYRLGADKVIVLDDSEKHYYQPLFTLVGGGMKTLADSHRPTQDLLSPLVTWVKDKAVKYNPSANNVEISNGDKIEYDYLVVASGIECHYDKIPGLLEALKIPKGPVCSIYSPLYVNRVYDAFQAFPARGNAIFTFPNSPVKCPGAPQKICYIFEHFLRRNKKKDGSKIAYNTSLPVIFGVKHYADALWKVVKERNITVNVRTNLVEVLPSGREAVFENLDSGEKFTTNFDLLHVVPPMGTSAALKTSGDLVNEAGFVNVNKYTLRHMKYPNVFALGDCSSSPNSKTAAAAAAQSQIVYNNLSAVIDGKEPYRNYDGYASCPLVTGYNSCILAEFDYNLQPLETFPVEQAKERWSMFVMKKDFMPPLYWHLMMNGLWNGPSFIRNSLHFFKNFTK